MMMARAQVSVMCWRKENAVVKPSILKSGTYPRHNAVIFVPVLERVEEAHEIQKFVVKAMFTFHLKYSCCLIIREKLKICRFLPFQETHSTVLKDTSLRISLFWLSQKWVRTLRFYIEFSNSRVLVPFGRWDIDLREVHSISSASILPEAGRVLSLLLLRNSTRTTIAICNTNLFASHTLQQRQILTPLTLNSESQI